MTAYPQSTLLQAAFIAMGLQPSHTDLQAVLDHWDGGCLELVDEATKYAPYAAALMDAGHAVTGDFPGIPVYEISEEFGAWFAKAVLETKEPCTLPKRERCVAALIELAFAFYLNGCDDLDMETLASPLREKLRLALANVPNSTPKTLYLEE